MAVLNTDARLQWVTNQLPGLPPFEFNKLENGLKKQVKYKLVCIFKILLGWLWLLKQKYAYFHFKNVGTWFQLGESCSLPRESQVIEDLPKKVPYIQISSVQFYLCHGQQQYPQSTFYWKVKNLQ